MMFVSKCTVLVVVVGFQGQLSHEGPRPEMYRAGYKTLYWLSISLCMWTYENIKKITLFYALFFSVGLPLVDKNTFNNLSLFF